MVVGAASDKKSWGNPQYVHYNFRKLEALNNIMDAMVRTTMVCDFCGDLRPYHESLERIISIKHIYLECFHWYIEWCMYSDKIHR